MLKEEKKRTSNEAYGIELKSMVSLIQKVDTSIQPPVLKEIHDVYLDEEMVKLLDQIL